MSDLDCFKHELALADLAEPLGFDSIWQPEHHFSGYEMTPNVLQFLTYMAGRTKTVRLGSMVVVLPWHNPLRVIEDVTQLDYYSGGRAILGIGRGLGAMEFGGFGIDMSDTRDLPRKWTKAHSPSRGNIPAPPHSAFPVETVPKILTDGVSRREQRRVDTG
jgi:alkanesulfonate monooxygenase SsuD/methylene tetrahydromethanopterin reductase-like flavin-dependent oxidoreductase (luciferase family)